MSSVESQATADLFYEVVSESSSGAEVAAGAKRRAEELRTMQDQTTSQVSWVFQDVSAVADTLEEKGSQVGSIIGSRATEEIPGSVAGYAYQGQQGSTVIDVTAALRPGSTQVIDVSQLQDTVTHERRHEVQSAAWNAQVVDIGNGRVLTRTEVSEADAMLQQQTITWVSGEYKGIYAKVLSIASQSEIADTAMTGDLVGLGDKILEKSGQSPMQEGEAVSVR